VTLVLDASVMVAALVDSGEVGAWAESCLLSPSLAAPHLLSVEVASALRRATAAGDISPDVAALAHEEFQTLRIEFFPYQPFVPRVWALRENVTPYDAWYVALAESLDAPLATLDTRLTWAAGPGCVFHLPT
jgi:predicted nucleic acid-binding protein